ncbi:hypothetical protein ACJX0J_021873 [Zea mays]
MTLLYGGLGHGVHPQGVSVISSMDPFVDFVHMGWTAVWHAAINLVPSPYRCTSIQSCIKITINLNCAIGDDNLSCEHIHGSIDILFDSWLAFSHRPIPKTQIMIDLPNKIYQQHILNNMKYEILGIPFNFLNFEIKKKLEN